MGQVVYYYKYLVGVDGQIYCFVNGWDCIWCIGVLVGEVVVGGNLIGFQYVDIEMVVVYYGEGVVVVEIVVFLQEGDIFFIGIDQFGIFFFGLWFWFYFQQVVFVVQEYFFVSGQVIGNLGWQVDVEVDVSIFGNIVGYVLGYFVMGQFLYVGFFRCVVWQLGFLVRRCVG